MAFMGGLLRIEEIYALPSATTVPTLKALPRLGFPRGIFCHRPFLPGSIFLRAAATRQKWMAF